MPQQPRLRTASRIRCLKRKAAALLDLPLCSVASGAGSCRVRRQGCSADAPVRRGSPARGMTEPHAEAEQKSFLELFASGAIAATIAEATTLPLDTAKVCRAP